MPRCDFFVGRCLFWGVTATLLVSTAIWPTTLLGQEQAASDTVGVEYDRAITIANKRPYPPHTLGLFGGLGVAFSDMPLNGVDGVPTCCKEYTDNSGLGWQVGLRYGIPVSAFDVVLSIGLLHTGVTSTVDQVIGRVLVDGVVVDAAVSNKLELADMRAMIGLGLDIPLATDFEVAASVLVGIPVSQTFSTRETMLTPGAVFENRLTERNVIESASVGNDVMTVVPSVGLRYMVNLAERWTLVPHVLLYWSPMTSSSNLKDWTWVSGMVGLGLERSL
jgi:hypothetical protein